MAEGTGRVLTDLGDDHDRYDGDEDEQQSSLNEACALVGLHLVLELDPEVEHGILLGDGHGLIGRPARDSIGLTTY